MQSLEWARARAGRRVAGRHKGSGTTLSWWGWVSGREEDGIGVCVCGL